MMVLRPEGIVTRAMVRRLSPRPCCSRRPALGSAACRLAQRSIRRRHQALRRPRRVRQYQLRSAVGRAHGVDRTERRRQDDVVQPDLRCLRRSTPAASCSTAEPIQRSAAAAPRARGTVAIVSEHPADAASLGHREHHARSAHAGERARIAPRAAGVAAQQRMAAAGRGQHAQRRHRRRSGRQRQRPALWRCARRSRSSAR